MKLSQLFLFRFFLSCWSKMDIIKILFVWFKTYYYNRMVTIECLSAYLYICLFCFSDILIPTVTLRIVDSVQTFPMRFQSAIFYEKGNYFLEFFLNFSKYITLAYAWKNSSVHIIFQIARFESYVLLFLA